MTPILGVDGCTAYSISTGTAYWGTPIATAFATFANPPEFELYDLQNDPIEFVNLAYDPQHLAVLNELKAALTTWRQDTQDPFLDQAVMDYYTSFSITPYPICTPGHFSGGWTSPGTSTGSLNPIRHRLSMRS